MKTVWVLDHYARPRHQQLAELNSGRYKTIRFMSAFIHNNPSADVNKTEVQHHYYGQVIRVRTLGYRRNDWRRSLNMVSYAVQVLLRAFRKPAPHVVVASCPHTFALAAGMLVAKLRRARFVIEVRDFWPRVLVELGGLREESLTTRLLYRLERWCYSASDGVIFVMPQGHLYLQELGINKPTTVIPNAIPRDLATDTKQTVVPEAARYSFVSVYTGLMGAATNVDVILDAAAILSERRPGHFGFLLYGQGSEKDIIEDKLAAMDLDNVHIMKPVTQRELLAILRANADATIFTAKALDVFRYGVSPNKITDYLAAAKPIVYSCESSNDVVQQAECGISVPPGDPVAMSAALEELADTPYRQRHAMGQRGYEYLKKNYIMEDQAKAFADFIERISEGVWDEKQLAKQD